MSVERVSLRQLPKAIARRMKILQGNQAKALELTAKDAVKEIQFLIPKAFGELAGSVRTRGHVDVGNLRVVVDAPHAAAVEIGSAPHKPNMEKLVAWVRLRGMQALSRPRALHLLGSTTEHHAMRIKELLSAKVVRASALGKGLGRGRASPIDAPTQVAMAIAKSIEAKGTRPHWYARNSLPVIAMRLSHHMRSRIKGR